MSEVQRMAKTRLINSLGVALCLMAVCVSGHATTKGLNQIVTPDIQPLGIFSTSFQVQNAAIGNGEQLQLELGITRSFEVAMFQGFQPGQSVFNWELGFVQSKSLLVSTGMLGIGNGLKPQPFLEAGYYVGRVFGIAGVERQDSVDQAVLGFGYQYTPKALITFDYISGNDNFATAGVTFTLTPNLSFNPALYVTNSSPHRVYPYGVLSWSSKVW